MNASNSASVDDVVSVDCLFADQTIGPPDKWMTYPWDENLVSGSSAKAASDDTKNSGLEGVSEYSMDKNLEEYKYDIRFSASNIWDPVGFCMCSARQLEYLDMSGRVDIVA